MCAVFDYELLCLSSTAYRWQEFVVRLQDLYGAAIAIVTSRLTDRRRAQMGLICEEDTHLTDIFTQSLEVQLLRLREPHGGMPTPRSIRTRGYQKQNSGNGKQRIWRVDDPGEVQAVPQFLLRAPALN